MQQQTALDILKSGQNVFLTGAPGTGKTYVINQYISYLESHGVKPSVVAPTGIAATHIGGSTIHSFFSLGLRDHFTDHDIATIVKKSPVISRLKKLNVLIIDEISMVSPIIFDAIDRILRSYHNSIEPFGGIQVVLSGDFFQLPPISREPVEERFVFQSSNWEDMNIVTCYLTKSYRQKDNKLLSLLQEIREANVSEDSMNLLRERYKKPPENGAYPIKLYTHNADIDRINQQELDRLPGVAISFRARTSGRENEIEKLFKSSLLREQVDVKIGAFVMFIKNAPEKGYVNGTQGSVIAFDDMTGFPIVKTSEGKVITVYRQEWEIEDHKGKVLATVSQIPLRLAWAITIHKSQGMTLDAAEMDLSKTFEMGQGYVAFSRVSHLSNITLMGLNNVALLIDEYVLEHDQIMRHASSHTEKWHASLNEEERSATLEVHLAHIGASSTPVCKSTKANTEPKQSTFEQTKALLLEKKSLEEISKVRGVQTKTILGHVEKLLQEDPTLDVSHLLPNTDQFESIINAVAAIIEDDMAEDFLENGEVRKKAIFDYLGGYISYEDISLALLTLPKSQRKKAPDSASRA